MKTIVFTLFVVFVLLNGTVLFADSTWVSGTIVGETWTIGNSPYCVNGDINVATLEIEPGVSVIFFGNYKFEVAGTLNAVGTELDSIIFDKAHPDTAGWRGILFNNNPSGSKLAYCRIQGSDSSGISIDNSIPSIKNCTIANNRGVNGGGINIELSTLTLGEEPILENCEIANNTASSYGGGINILDSPSSMGNMILKNCKISGNTSSSHGGGIRANLQGIDSLILQSCTINENVSNPTKARGNLMGGGLHFTGTNLILQCCNINGNKSFSLCNQWDCKVYDKGGAIYISSGNVTLTNSSVTENIAEAIDAAAGGTEYAYSYGGGIYLNSGTLALSNCDVTGNTAHSNSTHSSSYGGGIYIYSGNLTLTNCIVDRDSAKYTYQPYELRGGGVYVNTGIADLINSTVAYNDSGGLENKSGIVTAKNSIFFFNSARQLSGTVKATYSDIQDCWGVPEDSNKCLNPIFLSPESLIIVPGSPCIDGGDPDPMYNDVCFPPSLGTVRNDMGAHGGPFAGGWLESPTDKPILVSPDYNSSGGVNTTYTWRSVLWATEYQFQLDTSDVGDFVSPVMDTTISDTFYTVSGLDPNEVKGMNWWRVRGKNICDGPWSDPFIYTDVKEENYNEMPSQFSLNQNYPNPFNPETKLEFTLSKGCHVRLDIYNILGKRIRTLINEHQTAGYKRVSWDGKDDNGYEVPTGVYFYRIKAGEFTQAKKMVLLK